MGEKQLKITTNKYNKESQKEITTMYVFPLDRYYYANDPGHIWFKPVDSVFEVGFDFFGQQQAGPLLHIRTRPIGKEFPQGTAFGTVESDKWIGPLRLPLSAIIVEANATVLENPNLINDDCYGAWVIKIEPTKLEEEMKSKDIIPEGNLELLKKYIVSDLEKYDESPQKIDVSEG